MGLIASPEVAGETLADASRWRELLDDVAFLSDQVERMLSRQEDVVGVDGPPYSLPSSENIISDLLPARSCNRPLQPYDPLKYYSLDGKPIEDLCEFQLESGGSDRGFDDLTDSLERSLLVQHRLREQAEHIFERRQTLDSFGAGTFSPEALEQRTR